MSSKNKLIFNFFLVTVVLLMSSISALAAEDFTVKSVNKVVSMCSCETVEDSFVIKNTGDVPSTYKLRARGEAANWAEFIPDKFTLQPGQSGRLINEIQPKCGTTGTFGLMVVITTDNGLQKAFVQNIKTERCVNIGVGIEDNKLRGCQCSDFAYDFIIANTGNYDETYSFSVEPFSEFTEIEPDSVSIEPGKRKTVSVNISPACDIFGEYNLNFSTVTEKSQLLAATPFSLTAEQCYDYELVADSLEVCADASTLYNIIIENTADYANNYTLFLDAPSWVSLENETIELDEGKEGSFAVDFNPTSRKLGIHEMNIEVVAETGDVLRNTTVNLNVIDCYSFNLEIPVKSDKICCGLNSYDVILNNTGNKENKISIPVDNANLSISTDSITLQPGQASTLRLDTNFPCESKKLEITVTGTATETGMTSSDSLALEILTQEQCYALDFKDKSDRVPYENKSSVLRFQNKGIKFARYVFSLLEAPSWISLDSTTFELGMNDRAELLILSRPTEEIPEDNYLVSIQADAEGVTYQHDFILKLRHGKSLFETVKDFFITYLYYVIGVVVIIILVLVLVKVTRESKVRGVVEEIAEEKEEVISEIKKTKKKETVVEGKVERPYAKLLKIVLTVLIILVLIAGSFFVYYTSFYQPPLNEEGEKITTFGDDIYIISSNLWDSLTNYTYVNETVETVPEKSESFTYQVWDAYTTKTINLSENIVDPDGDILEFSVTEDDNLDVNLKDDILELTPKDGWNGETSMVVTAVDPHGGTVNVVMTLFVRDTPRLYPVAETYLDFVMIGVVLLVFIIGISREYEKRIAKRIRAAKRENNRNNKRK